MSVPVGPVVMAVLVMGIPGEEVVEVLAGRVVTRVTGP